MSEGHPRRVSVYSVVVKKLKHFNIKVNIYLRIWVWIFALCARVMECKIPSTEIKRFQGNSRQVAGVSGALGGGAADMYTLLCGKTLGTQSSPKCFVLFCLIFFLLLLLLFLGLLLRHMEVPWLGVESEL